MTAPAVKKPWLESDERKKALEAIPETARGDADEWDREQIHKQTLSKAREEYEKPAKKKSKWGSGE